MKESALELRIRVLRLVQLLGCQCNGGSDEPPGYLDPKAKPAELCRVCKIARGERLTHEGESALVSPWVPLATSSRSSK